MDKTIKNIGKDKWGRTVYQGESGRLYCDTAMNDRFGRGSKFCTKANNEFDGEPDLPMPQDWNPQIIESNTIKVNEAQLRNMIAESVKKVLKENGDDIFMTAYSGVQSLLIELCSKHRLAPQQAMQEIQKIINTFDADDLYDDDDWCDDDGLDDYNGQ